MKNIKIITLVTIVLVSFTFGWFFQNFQSKELDKKMTLQNQITCKKVGSIFISNIENYSIVSESEYKFSNERNSCIVSYVSDFFAEEAIRKFVILDLYSNEEIGVFVTSADGRPLSGDGKNWGEVYNKYFGEK